MKALLVGSGAVGIGIAVSLIKSGWMLHLIAEGATAEAIKKEGLKRTGILGEDAITPEQITLVPGIAAASESYDFLLVCTKALANESVAAQLSENKTLLHTSTKIVIFQNGWNTEAPFLSHFGADRVYNARVITGFSRPARHISEVSVHAAPVLLGSLHGADLAPLSPLAAAIAKGGLPCEVSMELSKALWAKMLYNCTLNPLGAVMNQTYGALAENNHTVFLMDRIMEEVFAVMEASGYSSFWPNAASYRETFYGQLVPQTKDHRPSTLQDLERGIPTEIDFLCGSVVRLGKENQVDTPFNEAMYHLIHALENAQRIR